MGFEYTKEERDALDEKMMYPAKKVICPRCGNEFTVKVVGNSMRVKCKTENCIVKTSRGI